MKQTRAHEQQDTLYNNSTAYKSGTGRWLPILLTLIVASACGDTESEGEGSELGSDTSSAKDGTSEVHGGECLQTYPDMIPTGISHIHGSAMTIANGRLYVVSDASFESVSLTGQDHRSLLSGVFSDGVFTQEHLVVELGTGGEFNFGTEQVQVYDLEGALLHEWQLERTIVTMRPDNKTGLIVTNVDDSSYSTLAPLTGEEAHYEFDTPNPSLSTVFVGDGSIWVLHENQLTRTAIGSTAVEQAGFDVYDVEGLGGGFLYFTPSSDRLSIARIPSDMAPPQDLDGTEGYALLAWYPFYRDYQGELLGINYNTFTVAHFDPNSEAPRELGSFSDTCSNYEFATMHEGGAMVVIAADGEYRLLTVTD